MKLALLNLSSVSNDDVAIIAAGMKISVGHVCDAWEHAPVEVAFHPGLQVAPVGWEPLAIFEQPDQPGCEGYHDVDENGRPYGRVFVSCLPQRIIHHDPNGRGASLAGLASHEADEMVGDLLANAWIDGPLVDPSTHHSYDQTAEELADAVQESAYQVTVNGQQVDASNFLYPAWFNPRAKQGPYDHMGVLKAPLTLAPGGYAIVRDSQAEHQVFSQLSRLLGRRKPIVKKIFHEQVPAAWREEAKRHHGGRTKRRLG